MKISTKGRYALRVLVDLAEHGTKEERVYPRNCGTSAYFR